MAMEYGRSTSSRATVMVMSLAGGLSRPPNRANLTLYRSKPLLHVSTLLYINRDSAGDESRTHCWVRDRLQVPYAMIAGLRA